MTRQDLLAALLLERYGPRRAAEKERPATPAQIRRRRRVLVGGKEENE
jgi:hypothetical protein